MNRSESAVAETIPPERLAEASVWIARLHGDARGRAVEDGFRRWLQEDPVNARAFELATDVWNEAANLRQIVPRMSPARRPAPQRPRPARFRMAWVALATAATLLIVAGVALHLRAADDIGTAVGEQRLLTLEDGTRIYLNTATRVVVNYDDRARRVELKAGEAIFNVAKRPGWPFIVTAGDRQVTALGTSFLVRRDDQRVAVTLMEGKVAVSSLASRSTSTLDQEGSTVHDEHAAPRVSQPSNDTFMMVPGERLTFVAGAFSQLDTPSLEKTTAWRRGQVVLDDTPLAAAAVEMNRYNAVKLVVEGTEARNLLVNGLFQAGDSLSFANAVAQTYGLRVIEREQEIILSGSSGH
jgi:transmembrane sensor